LSCDLVPHDIQCCVLHGQGYPTSPTTILFLCDCVFIDQSLSSLILDTVSNN